LAELSAVQQVIASYASAIDEQRVREVFRKAPW
jgi:hypothetical protein